MSFGEAVTAANNEPGPQTIHFAIPLGEYWLVNQIALLELEIGPFVLTDDATTIDFRTQTAFAGNTNTNGWEVGIYGLEPNGWGVAAMLVIVRGGGGGVGGAPEAGPGGGCARTVLSRAADANRPPTRAGRPRRPRV